MYQFPKFFVVVVRPLHFFFPHSDLVQKDFKLAEKIQTGLTATLSIL